MTTTVNELEMQTTNPDEGAGPSSQQLAGPSNSDNKPTPVNKDIEVINPSEPIKSGNEVAEANKKLIKEPETLPKQGDNSITMNNVYRATLGSVDRNVASNFLDGVASRINGRTDIVRRLDIGPRVMGAVLLHSHTAAPVLVEKRTQWERYFAINTRPANYVLSFGPNVPLYQYQREAALQYCSAATLDSKRIMNSLSGEMIINDSLSKQLSPKMWDNLIVHDCQAIYTIGWIIYFMLFDAETGNGTNFELRDIRQNVVQVMNVRAEGRQNEDAVIRMWDAGVEAGAMFLYGVKYPDEYIRVMRLISSGPSCINLTSNGCTHVGSHITSPVINWILWCNGDRVLPGNDPIPQPHSITGFMKTLAQDTKTAADMLKGYNRACSLINGVVFYYEMPIVVEQNVREQADARDDEAADGGNDGQGPVQGVAPPVQQEVVPEVPADPLELFMARITDLMNDAARQQRQELLRVQMPLIEEMAAQRRELALLHGVEAPRAAPAAAAGRPGIPARRYRRRSDHDRAWVIGDNRQLNMMTYYLPASLELGGAMLPAPAGSNILWRLLRIVDNITEPAWCLTDINTMFGVGEVMLNDMCPVVGTMISFSVSTIFNSMNIRGVDLHVWGHGPFNPGHDGVVEYLEQLIKPAQYPYCLIGETIPVIIQNSFSLTLNPYALCIMTWADAFDAFDDWEPNRGFHLMFPNRVPYIVHPISLGDMVTAWPHTLGVGSPEIKMHLEGDMAAYGLDGQRGWWSSEGCSDYQNAFESAPYMYIPYGLSVINALAQHFRMPAIPQTSYVVFTKKRDAESVYRNIVVANDVHYDAAAFMVEAGTCCSFDWAIHGVTAPCVVGNHMSTWNFARYGSITSETMLNAGYRVRSCLMTIITPEKMQLTTNPNVFVGAPPPPVGLGVAPYKTTTHSEN